ncbi:hypothetical protein SAMN02745220_04463 [Desulfopila aestuarii DSM 18488]|uniref:Glycosyltransferase 2-like domain-containing protein n=2 Tax=Desulfopila aestuarii TaxID=231440 RepID=A0A1M7YI11_9BACT|nr:hypothetical protein SAMN02745220_04463 [Desulfopila aestuarii DSM 18488]
MLCIDKEIIHLHQSKQQQMDVSIIIINYNTRELTHACLQSVYAETAGLRFEVIVIDNASVDGSREFLSSLTFKNYRYCYNDENLGFSRANNQAAAMAAGNYLFFMNSDMIFLNNVPLILKEHMERHSEVGILGPCFRNPDMTLQISCRNFPSLVFGCLKFFPFLKLFLSREATEYYQKERDYSSVQEVDTVSAGALFIRRQLFETIGRFDEFSFMYAEDADICRQVRDRGLLVVFQPAAQLVHYGGQSSQLNSSKAIWSYYFAFYHLYKKYYFGRLAIMVKPLFLLRAVVALAANMVRKDKRITWQDK